MVFTNLPSHEKDAFFSLLDEYFDSRPELLAKLASSDVEGQAGQGQAAASIHRALAANPDATAKLVSAGLKHGVPKSSPYSAAASNPEIGNAMGKVAAASLAFSAPGNTPPARRGFNTAASEPSQSKSPAVDAGSAKASFNSLRNTIAQKVNATPQSPTPSPPAGRKNPFQPPPGRSAPSAPEEEPAAGEWAEALYPYSSEDPGDLELSEGQQVLVLERTSGDWWTGEVDGKKGLFPASYVKLL